jgi:hypothetical protein
LKSRDKEIDDDLPDLIPKSYESDSDEEEEPEAIKEHKVDLDLGTTKIDGIQKSMRTKSNENQDLANFVSELKEEQMCTAFDEMESAFSAVTKAVELQDVPISPYFPEPKSLKDIFFLPESIQNDWVKSIQKEVKFLIEDGTFKRREKLQDGDGVIPSMIIFKAKVTSRGYLDKLKAKCVARGDLQQKCAGEDVWSPCVFRRTFKMFVADAAKRKNKIKQLDFIGVFCRGKTQKRRMFIQLPKEYAEILPEYAECFNKPQLIVKSIYGTDVGAKVLNNHLIDWLTINEHIKFFQSKNNSSLFVLYRDGEEYCFLITYVDDCLYEVSSDEIEKKITKYLKERFDLE